ncbi:asparaginase [Candidatus Peregrinibacteria bacterium CG_4_9_14_0_2_um_filter_53_11]|nr:MAG: asparaginase [Candidatus Peregrinibacteria bacterium CG_4_9_14_0_2_um_filter_53_11]
MAISIFLTGGTFDKEYDELTGNLFFRDTHVPEMLSMAHTHLDIELRTLMLIDSLDMSEADRLMIADNCAKSPSDEIVITHGTDTMVETARAIAQRVEHKTIVLTGAMIPFRFGSSDGLFNLGSALAFAQILPPGVYIAMNGQYFNWDNCRKNKKLGRFEEIE